MCQVPCWEGMGLGGLELRPEDTQKPKDAGHCALSRGPGLGSQMLGIGLKSALRVSRLEGDGHICSQPVG